MALDLFCRAKFRALAIYSDYILFFCWSIVICTFNCNIFFAQNFERSVKQTMAYDQDDRVDDHIELKFPVEL